MDPKFKRILNGDTPMTREEEKAVNDDLWAFFEDANKTDAKLKNLAEKDDN